MDVPAPLRLAIDDDALAANWRAMARLSRDAACGAAVKADGYGLGARHVVRVLAAAGCRDFFVATWSEVAAIADLIAGHDLRLSVLHGVRDEDMAAATTLPARPVLNTPQQVARWREGGGGRACDVMVDTGMHRLGVAAGDVAGGLLAGLAIDTLMSHLACADEPSPMNMVQRDALAALAGSTDAVRLSLANSAGVTLGRDYRFGLTRPGLALYGGEPCAALSGVVRQVVRPQAQILQRRCVRAGGAVGYNATWTAPVDTEVAILNLGYADGYLRGFSGRGAARCDDARLPVIGRVSMDLTAIDVTNAAHLAEGDWVEIDYHLPSAAAASGLSQYELLTGLGIRFDRRAA
nr:alanine racemase [Sphingomonas baiyangensis]